MLILCELLKYEGGIRKYVKLRWNVVLNCLLIYTEGLKTKKNQRYIGLFLNKIYKRSETVTHN